MLNRKVYQSQKTHLKDPKRRNTEGILIREEVDPTTKNIYEDKDVTVVSQL